MKDPDNRENPNKTEEVGRSDPSRENKPLSTRDMAAGAAARQAPERVSENESGLSQLNENQNTANIDVARSTPLFEAGEAEGFRSRWMQVQTKFVDEPRRSVEEADQLVAGTMKRLAEVFAGERERLERDWDRGGDVSTEDLRLALQRYRSFFDRLLSI